jgi:hypothetical protein
VKQARRLGVRLEMNESGTVRLTATTERSGKLRR